MLTIDINVAFKGYACAFRLSSNWSYFSEECDHLKLLFSRLKYPDKLISSAITHFIAVKVSDELDSPADTNESDPVHIALPFKDQALADNQYLWNQLKDLSQKILITVQPVFVQDLKLRGTNSALFSNLNVTCAMQVMVISHAGTYISALLNIKARPHLLASIPATHDLSFLKDLS